MIHVGCSVSAKKLRYLPPCGGGLGRGVAATAVRVAYPSPRPSPARGEGTMESLSLTSGLIVVPAFALLSQGRRRSAPSRPQFVFATRGGIADVTNDVASSIAKPSGVGMLIRNGTRMRVPAIGTKAISMRRSVARYLMTGRSGM